MGLISAIKKIFNKTIILDIKHKDDLVTLLKGASGKVKVGTPIQIENGYMLVSTHYNNVCDVLHEGNYKVENLDMPRLFYLCQKRVLGKKYKTIIADLYCVNLKEYKNIVFRSQGNIFVKTCNGKKGIKISGEFSFNISNPQKFMQSMCEEYSVVKNKSAMRDIAYIVASDITYILRKNLFDLASIVSNSDDVKKLLLEKLKKLEKTLGLSVNDVIIYDVDVPLDLQRELDTIKSISNLDNIFSQTEEEKEEIFVGVPNSNSSQNMEKFSQNEAKDEDFIDFSTQNTQNFTNTPQFDTLQESPKIFEEEKNSSQYVEEEKKQSSSNKKVCDNCKNEYDERELFCPKCGKREGNYKLCPCCGAKNFDNATNCCVCNSKL